MKKMLILLGQSFLAAHRVDIPECDRMQQWPRFYGNSIDYIRLVISPQVKWYIHNHEHIVTNTPTGKACIIAMLNSLGEIPCLNSRVYYFHTPIEAISAMCFGRIRLSITPPESNNKLSIHPPQRISKTFQ